MLDPRRLRTELDALKAGIARRGVDPSVLDEAAELDRRQRDAAGKRDELRNRINVLSKEVGEAYRSGDKASAEAKKEESRALAATMRALDNLVRVANGQRPRFVVNGVTTPAPSELTRL